MRRTSAFLIVSLMVFYVLTGCAAQPSDTENTAVPTPASSVAQSEPTIEPKPEPTPEPKPFVPEDLFGSEFNPYAEAAFPENFNIYAASFDVGDPKMGGEPKYVLSMTAEGKADESIAFLAKLAGVEENGSKYVEEFNGGGFCEFKSSDGATFTIRKTDSNDDRYEYVDGCHIDIVRVVDGQVSAYIKLISDNFNLNALSASADYFDITPSFDVCGIYLNRHKSIGEVSVSYNAADAETVQQQMAQGLKPNWYDAERGSMGFSYGMVDLVFEFDGKGGKIRVSEKTTDFKSPARDYSAPEVSLTTLGFYYADKDAMCIYEDKQNGISIAIYKPEWGTGSVDWNIEYLFNANKYLVAVWYYADDHKYRIQADKDGSSAGYEYDINADTFGNEWPDFETVRKQFGKALDMQDGGFYPKALEQLEQTVKDRFGMSVEELYALPAK